MSSLLSILPQYSGKSTARSDCKALQRGDHGNPTLTIAQVAAHQQLVVWTTDWDASRAPLHAAFSWFVSYKHKSFPSVRGLKCISTFQRGPQRGTGPFSEVFCEDAAHHQDMKAWRSPQLHELLAFRLPFEYP